MKVNTDQVITAILGAVMIFYLIAETFDDAGEAIENGNESVKGGKIIKLLPLVLAFGLVLALFRMFSAKK